MNEWMSDELNNNADCCWYIYSSWQSKSFQIDELNYLYTKREIGERGEEAMYLNIHFYFTLIHTTNEFLETKVSQHQKEFEKKCMFDGFRKKKLILDVLHEAFEIVLYSYASIILKFLA